MEITDRFLIARSFRFKIDCYFYLSNWIHLFRLILLCGIVTEAACTYPYATLIARNQAQSMTQQFGDL